MEPSGGMVLSDASSAASEVSSCSSVPKDSPVVLALFSHGRQSAAVAPCDPFLRSETCHEAEREYHGQVGVLLCPKADVIHPFPGSGLEQVDRRPWV